MARAPDEWPFLERLAFIIELDQYPVERRAGLMAERGLTAAKIEEWKAEARKRLPYLPPPTPPDPTAPPTFDASMTPPRRSGRRCAQSIVRAKDLSLGRASG